MMVPRRDRVVEWQEAPRGRRGRRALVVFLLSLAGLLVVACDRLLPPPVEISTTSIPTLHVFEPYQHTLVATGGRTPYTWLVHSLPDGLSFDPATGVIASDADDPAIRDPRPVDLIVTVFDARGTSATKTFRLDTVSVAAVSGGDLHSCALDSLGAAWCWGSNSHGQLGHDDGSSSDLPVAVVGGQAFSAISAGFHHSCALDLEGMGWCWGSNESGQLGDGSNTDSHEPVAVVAGAFRAISAGGSHTCGIGATAGSAWCWGANDSGQLGNTSNDDRNAPVAASGGGSYSVISTGRFHSCALRIGTDAAWCWGSNEHGMLGRSTGASINRPVAVQNAGAFTAIALGEEHSCALGLSSGGTAWCWGSNEHGQLGNPTTALVSTHIPTTVKGGDHFATISVGAWHACGLTTGGTAKCWGHNYSGQLADGSLEVRTSPVEPIGTPELVEIVSGGYHTCGLTEHGALWCWGSNVSGQIGVGSAATPIQPAPVRPGSGN